MSISRYVYTHFMIFKDDYHFFEELQDDLALTGLRYKYEEIGVGDYGKYYAVFWLSDLKKPIDFIEEQKNKFE